VAALGQVGHQGDCPAAQGQPAPLPAPHLALPVASDCLPFSAMSCCSSCLHFRPATGLKLRQIVAHPFCCLPAAAARASARAGRTPGQAKPRGADPQQSARIRAAGWGQCGQTQKKPLDSPLPEQHTAGKRAGQARRLPLRQATELGRQGPGRRVRWGRANPPLLLPGQPSPAAADRGFSTLPGLLLRPRASRDAAPSRRLEATNSNRTSASAGISLAARS